MLKYVLRFALGRHFIPSGTIHSKPIRRAKNVVALACVLAAGVLLGGRVPGECAATRRQR